MKNSAISSRGFLSRRSLLRGAGVTLALPFLESVAPRGLRAAEPTAPVRLMYWFIPNGILYDKWIPKVVGALDPAAPPESLAPLAAAGVLGDVNILSGVDNLCGYPETVGDHASGMSAMLTCVAAKKVIEGVELGISVDQVAAAALGKATPKTYDETGNVVFRKTARNFNQPAATCGKVCVVEVEEIVPVGSLDPDCIHLPGVYVQRLICGAPYDKKIEFRTTRTTDVG